jgi:hypothetical protein
MLPRHLAKKHGVPPEDIDALLPETYRRRTRSERERDEADADDPDAVESGDDAQGQDQVEEPAAADPDQQDAGNAAADQAAGRDPGNIAAAAVPMGPFGGPLDPNDIDPNDPMYPFFHPVGIAEREAAERAAAAAAGQGASQVIVPQIVAPDAGVPQIVAANPQAAAPDAGNGQPGNQDAGDQEAPEERGIWVNPPSGARSTTSSGTYSPVLPQAYVRASDVDIALRGAVRATAGPSGISSGVQQAAAAATSKKSTPKRKTPAKSVVKGKAPAIIR